MIFYGTLQFATDIKNAIGLSTMTPYKWYDSSK